MASSRAERLALNEAAFRLANERMAAWEESHEDAPAERYFCECKDLDCRQGVQLDRGEYEAVRSDALHFVVVPGHADPSVEQVVRHTDRYDVVEKYEEVRPLVERTDPRRA